MFCIPVCVFSAQHSHADRWVYFGHKLKAISARAWEVISHGSSKEKCGEKNAEKQHERIYEPHPVIWPLRKFLEIYEAKQEGNRVEIDDNNDDDDEELF